MTSGGDLGSKNEQDQTRLDQEVIVYYVRKLETEQLQKMQIQNQVERMQEQVSRLQSDKEFLRAQLKLQERTSEFLYFRPYSFQRRVIDNVASTIIFDPPLSYYRTELTVEKNCSHIYEIIWIFKCS